MRAGDVRRRLVAILAADAAGYSRLMASDEHATVVALDAARKIFRSQIASHHGRVVDTAGDSVLAVFDTAVGALDAAVSIQKMLGASTEGTPEDSRMRFRIGLHVGDVSEKADGSVYGDGVNIAARLQALARSGGIAVSDSVRNAVRGKFNALFEDLGEQTMKNIAGAVRTFAVRMEGELAEKPKLAAGRMGLPLPDARSIAVLPFANMSGNADNAYFADGMHEELLTQLAQLSELKIVSRTSVMEYRESKKNVRQIAAELGVLSLVEGSVRRAGDRVRVTAQLIDTESDRRVWGKSFDRDLTDIFAIQSEIATEIARALKVKLTPGERARIDKKPTQNLIAYDAFLRHQELKGRTDTSLGSLYLKERIALLEQAVRLDPDFALAWARLAGEHAFAYFFGVDHVPARLSQARRAIDRALALAPDDIEVLIEEGAVHYGRSDYERAAKSYENILSTAPNNVEALIRMAFIRRRELRWKECAAILEQAVAIDPRNVKALSVFASFLKDFRHFDRALDVQQQLMEVRPHDLSVQVEYQSIEYSKSGSLASFDSWRSTLPPNAEHDSVDVHVWDVARAGARRDFDEALRLLDAPPKDLPLEQLQLLNLWKAMTFLVKGDRTRAIEAARAGLREVTHSLEESPDTEDLHMISAEYRAILGEREAALAENRTAFESTLARKDLLGAIWVQRQLLFVYAFLGDREAMLRELRRILKRPVRSSAYWFKIDWRLALFSDDPEFQAIVDDPAHHAPLPFDLSISYTMDGSQET